MLSVALSLGAALVFRYDIMGYDTYLPGEGRCGADGFLWTNG